MKISCGLLLYHTKSHLTEVLLAHPGGPFWAKKDVWSIVKGEVNAGEDDVAAAYREFTEETGIKLPPSTLLDLGAIKEPSKINRIWAAQADLDTSKFNSQSFFEIEWPPHSGQKQTFPEVDRLKWFPLEAAQIKLFKGQKGFIDRLADQLHIQLEQAEQQTLL